MPQVPAKQAPCKGILNQTLLEKYFEQSKLKNIADRIPLLPGCGLFDRQKQFRMAANTVFFPLQMLIHVQ